MDRSFVNADPMDLTPSSVNLGTLNKSLAEEYKRILLCEFELEVLKRLKCLKFSFKRLEAFNCYFWTSDTLKQPISEKILKETKFK